jgi:hypothetical protein
MARLAQITQAGYLVEIQWQCEFDKGILDAQPDLEINPVVLHEPLNTRNALYGGRTEAMMFHHKAT